MENTVGPAYTSLGSLIIDTIRYVDGTEQLNVLGGAGSYGVMGMRVWFTPDNAWQVGYITQEGHDFPESMAKQIASFRMSLVRNVHPDKHTTRGLNVFGPDDHRDFEYLHPIIRLTCDDVPQQWVKSIRAMHLIASPDRAMAAVIGFQAREKQVDKKEGTFFVWEPGPWSCQPQLFTAVCEAAPNVDILTPNHEEAASLLNIAPGQNHAEIESCARQLLKAAQPKRAVVIRAGRFGAVCITRDGDVCRWVPAYWDESSYQHVRDVTGAGNAFCGGMCVGLTRSGGDALQACLYGAVSASFVVEQVGMPTGTGDGWNGDMAQDRLQRLEERMALLSNPN